MDTTLQSLIDMCQGDISIAHTIILAAQAVGIDWRCLSEVIIIRKNNET